MKNYIKVENLSKKFKNSAGVENINFTIEKGELVGLIGDNGAGKTTTIKLIFGELKPQTGKILFEGGSIKKSKILELIAFFPDQNNFPKNLNIIEFAIYSASLKGVNKSEVQKTLDLYVSALNLDEFRKNKFSELSAGMQKRALLLSVLVCNPEVIILDEPTANLDIKSRIEFMNILKFLSEHFKKTIIITSHNIDELNNLVDRVVLINKTDSGRGEVIYDAKFDPKNENLKDIYLRETGFKNSAIDFEGIKDIEENKDATNTVKEKSKKPSIFNWTIRSIVKSKSFWIMSIISFLTFLGYGIFLSLDKSSISYTSDLSIKIWMLIGIIIFYIGFYETKTINQIFLQHLKDSIIQLEIRSGKSTTRIFLERLMANKIVIWVAIVLFMLMFGLFGYISQTELQSQIFYNLIPGLAFLFVLDFLISGIIVFCVSVFRSAIFAGSAGTLITIMLMISFIVGNLIVSLGSSISFGKQNFQYDEISYQLLEDFQDVKEKYGEDSIINKHLQSLDEINNLYTSNESGSFVSEYTYLLNSSTEFANPINVSYTNTAEYLESLIKSGLLTEIDKLQIYRSTNSGLKNNLSDLNKDNLYVLADESRTDATARIKDSLRRINNYGFDEEDYTIGFTGTNNENKVGNGDVKITPKSESKLLGGEAIVLNPIQRISSEDLSNNELLNKLYANGLSFFPMAEIDEWKKMTCEIFSRTTGIPLNEVSDNLNFEFKDKFGTKYTEDKKIITDGSSVVITYNNNSSISLEMKTASSKLVDLKTLNLDMSGITSATKYYSFESYAALNINDLAGFDGNSNLIKMGTDYEIIYSNNPNKQDFLSPGEVYIKALDNSKYLTGESFHFKINPAKNSLQPQKLEINNEVYNNNELINFLNGVKEIQPYSGQSVESNGTLFVQSEGWNGVQDQSKRYKQKGGLYELIETIDEGGNQELKDIAKIIERAAKYSYQSYSSSIAYYGYSSYNNDYLASSLENYNLFDTSASVIWNFAEGKSEFNATLQDKMQISDGARTFNKIYVDLLYSLNFITQTNYAMDNNGKTIAITDDKYTEKARNQTFVNPLKTFSDIIMYAGINEDLIASQPFSNGVGKTFFNKTRYVSLKENAIVNKVNDQKSYRQNGGISKISTNAQFFNTTTEDNSISKAELDNLILSVFNLSNEEKQNVEISISRIFVNRDSRVSANFIVYSDSNNASSLVGAANVEVSFNQPPSDVELTDQFTSIENALNKGYETKTNEEISQMKLPYNIYDIGSKPKTFNILIGVAIWATISLIIMLCGYFIFIKRLIF